MITIKEEEEEEVLKWKVFSLWRFTVPSCKKERFFARIFLIFILYLLPVLVMTLKDAYIFISICVFFTSYVDFHWSYENDSWTDG